MTFPAGGSLLCLLKSQPSISPLWDLVQEALRAGDLAGSENRVWFPVTRACPHPHNVFLATLTNSPPVFSLDLPSIAQTLDYHGLWNVGLLVCAGDPRRGHGLSPHHHRLLRGPVPVNAPVLAVFSPPALHPETAKCGRG